MYLHKYTFLLPPHLPLLVSDFHNDTPPLHSQSQAQHIIR